MTHERANRIAWIGWGLTLPLAYLGPVMRALSGIRGSGNWPIFAAVGVMLAVLVLIRRDRRALFLALDMNLSGLAIGVTGGFVSTALLSGHLLAALLALKWVLAGAFLTWHFRRALHDRGLTPEQEQQIEARYNIHHIAGRYLGVPPEDVEEMLTTLTVEQREDLSHHVATHWQREMDESDASFARLRRRSRALLCLTTVALIGMSLLLWFVRHR